MKVKRKILIILYNRIECDEFKSILKEILVSNLLTNDDSEISIDQKYIDLYKEKASELDKKITENLGIEVPDKELPKSWIELKKIGGYFVDQYSGVKSAFNLTTNNDYHKNVFSSKEEVEACLALSQLSQFKKIYNNHKKIDFKKNTVKYSIHFYKGEINTDTVNGTNRFLSFYSEEIRDKFLENFRDLIMIAKPLL